MAGTSLALTPATSTGGWDIHADASGNIATISGIEAQVQDVACACRLFLGELWYDTTQGIPYINDVLGRPAPPPLSFISAVLIRAGLTVPGVASITPDLTLTNRLLTGSITVTNQQGQTGTLQVGGGDIPWYVNAVSSDTPD